MTLIESFVLGILQGATEFLPISSSGHLIVIPRFLDWNLNPLLFDTTLHLGTGLAILVYFWKDLIQAFRSNRKLLLTILIGSFPAGILGLFLNDLFENFFRSPLWVALFLVLGSILLWCSEKFSKDTQEEVTMKKGFVIGLFQALALFPGVSRSGATISAGMLLGLKKETAAKFSFLLSIFIVWGAGFYQAAKSFGHPITIPIFNLFVGFIASSVSGILFMKFLFRYLKKHTFVPFVVYRLLLAGVIIATLC